MERCLMSRTIASGELLLRLLLTHTPIFDNMCDQVSRAHRKYCDAICDNDVQQIRAFQSYWAWYRSCWHRSWTWRSWAGSSDWSKSMLSSSSSWSTLTFVVVLGLLVCTAQTNSHWHSKTGRHQKITSTSDRHARPLVINVYHDIASGGIASGTCLFIS